MLSFLQNDSIVALSHIKELFEQLQPGCNGVITNYTSIPRANVKKAYEYMNEALVPSDEAPPDWSQEFEEMEKEHESLLVEPEGDEEGETDSHKDTDKHDEL